MIITESPIQLITCIEAVCIHMFVFIQSYKSNLESDTDVCVYLGRVGRSVPSQSLSQQVEPLSHTEQVEVLAQNTETTPET